MVRMLIIGSSLRLCERVEYVCGMSATNPRATHRGQATVIAEEIRIHAGQSQWVSWCDYRTTNTQRRIPGARNACRPLK